MFKKTVNLLRRVAHVIFCGDEDRDLSEHVSCRGPDSLTSHVWVLEPELYRAVCENDRRVISVRDEVQAVFAVAFSELQGTSLGNVLLNNSRVVDLIVANLLLTLAIMKADRAETIHIHELFRCGKWWAGCGYYVDHLLKHSSEFSAVISVRRHRWLARALRDRWLLLRQLLLAFGKILSLRKEIGLWQVPFSGAPTEVGSVESLWIEPAATFVAFLQEFVKVASQHHIIHSIHLVFPQLEQAELTRLGFQWQPRRLSWPTLAKAYLREVLARTKEVRELLGRPTTSQLLHLCDTMRPFWNARVVGDAKDAIWQSVFPQLISRERPTLTFVTHRIGHTIAAFSRVVREMPQVKTIYIQHGVTPRVCCPIVHDEYWLLLPEEKAYLQSLGIDRPIRMVNRNKDMILSCLENEMHGCNRTKKLFCIMQHPLLGTALTSQYLYHGLDRIARVAEEMGWEFVVRPHPQDKRIGGLEALMSSHPAFRLLDVACPLMQQLREEEPAVAVTFFSTSAVEAIGSGALPVLLQSGLQSITDRVSCDYGMYGVVLRNEEQADNDLRTILTNEHYRDEEFARLRNDLYRVVAESEKLNAVYADTLVSFFADQCAAPPQVSGV
jgi:hypothetical protein